MALDSRLLQTVQAIGTDIKALFAQRGATNGVAPLVAGIVPLVNLPALGGGSDPWTYTALGLDAVNSTVTMAAVAGMNFVAVPDTYLVEAIFPAQSAATTTGIALALDVPVGSQVFGLGLHASTASALTSFEQVADAVSTGASTGFRAANTQTLVQARWLVFATAGTVQLMMRSEVAAIAVTLKAGGVLGRRAL